jgi:hypothetical protein
MGLHGVYAAGMEFTGELEIWAKIIPSTWGSPSLGLSRFISHLLAAMVALVSVF